MKDRTHKCTLHTKYCA